MEEKKVYPLGLVLSGGGAKGFAHLGVLEALDEKQIKPDIIAGTSAGALAGVLYADGHSPRNILSFFQKKAFKEFAELTIPQSGIFKTDRLHSFLEKHLKARTFEDLRIPMVVTATDIEKGTCVYFDKGPLISAIVASCSFPIVFTPVQIDGTYYVDGGLFKNFPVSPIRKLCDKVIGVNVAPLTGQKYKNSLFYIAERSFHYVSVSNSLPDRKKCDLLIESPRVSKFQMFSLDDIDDIYKIGYEAAIEKLNENISLFENQRAIDITKPVNENII